MDAHIVPDGRQGIHSAERALPDVTQQALKISMPVVILPGENDANVPPRGAEALASALEKAGSNDETLHMYPGLGQSLEEASSVSSPTNSSQSPQYPW